MRWILVFLFLYLIPLNSPYLEIIKVLKDLVFMEVFMLH